MQEMASNSATELSPHIQLPGWESTPQGIDLYVALRNAHLIVRLESRNYHHSPQALKTLLLHKSKVGYDDDSPEFWDYMEWVASLFAS